MQVVFGGLKKCVLMEFECEGIIVNVRREDASTSKTFYECEVYVTRTKRDPVLTTRKLDLFYIYQKRIGCRRNSRDMYIHVHVGIVT